MSEHSGGDFDEFLEEQGILGEVTARAHKRLLALELAEAMKSSKTQLAEKLQTSRSQLDCVLNHEQRNDR